MKYFILQKPQNPYWKKGEPPNWPKGLKIETWWQIRESKILGTEVKKNKRRKENAQRSAGRTCAWSGKQRRYERPCAEGWGRCSSNQAIESHCRSRTNPPLFASASVYLLSLLPFFHTLLRLILFQHHTNCTSFDIFGDFLMVNAHRSVIFGFHLKCTLIYWPIIINYILFSLNFSPKWIKVYFNLH